MSIRKKTDAELDYIIKDAGEAAETMRGFDRAAECKYLDQVNDAVTERSRRQRKQRINGQMPHASFYLIADARAHREKHGGWLFLPDDGTHPVWFNVEFTPGAIMLHPLTAGRSGRVTT